MKEHIEEMAKDLDTMIGNSSQMKAEKLYAKGWRKQKEGEWEMFSLITSTYYGKQYYFLNKNGSVYSRASHSNMSRDEAVDEFLSIFRE